MKHPLGPKIIFSYGMTKCGSTLAFELARTGLELSGYEQPKLPVDGLTKNSTINFASHLTDLQLSNIWKHVQKIGHPIVIKTHTRPDKVVIDLINQGHALVQATYRDPRDMALSMIDHGNRNRSLGRAAFSEILDLGTAKENITSQIDSLTQWLVRPNCLPLYFDDLAFDTEATTRFILAHLQLEICPRQVARFVKNRRFIQMNKGVKSRYKSEMSRSEAKTFKKSFAPLYNTLIKRRKTLPLHGVPILPEGTVLLSNTG